MRGLGRQEGGRRVPRPPCRPVILRLPSVDAPGQASCLAGCVCACACWGDNALRGPRRGACGSTLPGCWRRNLQMGTRVSLRSLTRRRGPGPEPSLQSRDTRWGEGGSRVSRRDGVWRGSELGLSGRDRRWGGGAERAVKRGGRSRRPFRGVTPALQFPLAAPWGWRSFLARFWPGAWTFRVLAGRVADVGGKAARHPDV